MKNENMFVAGILAKSKPNNEQRKFGSINSAAQELIGKLGQKVAQQVAFLVKDNFEEAQYKDISPGMKLGAPISFWGIDSYVVLSVGIDPNSNDRMPTADVTLKSIKDGTIRRMSIAPTDYVTVDPNNADEELLARLQDSDMKNIWSKLFDSPRSALQIAQAKNNAEIAGVTMAIDRYIGENGVLTALEYLTNLQEDEYRNQSKAK